MSNCSSVRGRSSYSQTIFAGNFEINSVIDIGKREEKGLVMSQFEHVHQFKYLGQTVNNEAKSHKEIVLRIA